ncbi:MAG: winged helix-turn-helix transcriptional regulator, partial [Cytophagales bacterium]|nr:winged helix-turn-helix transcriptional regulator [Cytophagales bacterium]
MIGHQVLLQSGDSTSRVLPVEKEGKRYKVQFASAFQFDPDSLVSLVNSVVEKSQVAESYLVEVETCLTKQVVYGYEIRTSHQLDLVPCKGRIQPKGCYALFFTILDAHRPTPAQSNISLKPSVTAPGDQKRIDYSQMAVAMLAVLLLIGIPVYFKKRSVTTGAGGTTGESVTTNENVNLINLGEYQFDPRNMELRLKNEVVKLTSKETDLLLLLHTSANSTLERELILKTVWGDEGDYVGRTLDVFISKLRKKLDADAS